jgi:hypothetical protein
VPVGFHWDTKDLDTEDFWVSYLQSAFPQRTFAPAPPDDPLGRAFIGDADPNSEDSNLGVASPTVGGSLIFREIHSEVARAAGLTDAQLVFLLAQTVVHEVGRALTGSGIMVKIEPNNLIGSGVVDNQGLYLPAFFHLIRQSPRPVPY